MKYEVLYLDEQNKQQLLAQYSKLETANSFCIDLLGQGFRAWIEEVYECPGVWK